MNQKIVVGVATAAVVAGAALLGLKKEPVPTCEHISDPKACVEFLKIKNPTPTQVRLYEDSHTP